MAMYLFNASCDESAAAESAAGFFVPDQAIRSAISFCWMNLRKGRRNAEELRKEVNRVVDRALRQWREDQDAFSTSRENEKES